MAPQLWLLRHGEAVPHDSKPDPEREVTPRGERQALAAGAALARLGIEFDACYTSPKLRALQTAELACRSLGVEPVTEDAIGAGFDRDDALALLRAHGDDARVLVVGHEPDFSQVVYDLTGGRVDFKKGGIAAVRETVTGMGELLVLLRPRELDAMAVAAAQPAAAGD
jgi:phosphohistidine phosphatase